MWRSTTMWYAFKGVHCITSWNSMPLVTFVVLLIVPVPLLAGAVPQIVELFHNLWNSDPISGPVPLFGELFHICGTLFHKLWNCSTFCRTVPQKVELFHFVSVFLDTANELTQKTYWIGHKSTKTANTSQFHPGLTSIPVIVAHIRLLSLQLYEGPQRANLINVKWA